MSTSIDGVDPLKKSLLQIVEQHSVGSAIEDGTSLKDKVFTCLYISASDGAQYYDAFFPQLRALTYLNYNKSLFHIYQDALRSPETANQIFCEALKKIDIGMPNKPGMFHQGRPCSRKFKKGEAIYRCRDCGFDDTCVMCSYCFNPKDHEHHSVVVSIASASNEGICDCGDPEAWNRELQCNCVPDSLPYADKVVVTDSMKAAFRRTFQGALDYIIDVMIHQDHTLPIVHSAIESSSSIAADIREASTAYNDDVTTNSSKYCLVLWNDEVHNYPDATSRIQAALNCTAQKAQEYAVGVDQHGRMKLMTSYDMDELISAFFVVQRTGLVATINSERDFYKQELVLPIIEWLEEVLTFINPEIQKWARKIYCEVLTSAFNPSSSRACLFDASSRFYSDIEEKTFLHGLLMRDNKIPREVRCTFKDADMEIETLKSKFRDLMSDKCTGSITNSRVQYLLYFDIRFWKETRKAIHNIITPVLVSDLSYKPIFADQVLEIYPHLLKNMADLDREWLLNVLNDMTVQLFTCPKTSLRILQSGSMGKIFAPLIELFEKDRSFTTSNGDILWKKREAVSEADHHPRTVWFTQRKALRDLVQLIEHPTFTSEHLVLFEMKNFLFIILLLKRFQSNWKIKRKEGAHVLRESTEFAPYFELNTTVYELVSALSQIVSKGVLTATETQQRNLSNAVMILNNFLELGRACDMYIDQGDFHIRDFKVSKKEVGFMNPLNSLLSYLIESARIRDFTILDKTVYRFNVNGDLSDTGTLVPNFVDVSDLSLRTLVLCAQIRVGFWVRNGLLVGKQEALYSGSYVAEHGVFRDIHLQQLSVILEPLTKRSLFNFLERFSLLSWFLNKEKFEETEYEERVFFICEEFITFFYHLYSSRLNFRTELSGEVKKEYKIRNLICYTLCRGLSSYSQLCKNLPQDIVSHPRFEAILEEVSHYTPPQGLSDSGLYRLKKSMFKTLDPLSMFIEAADMSEISNAIKQELAATSKSKSDEIVINPELMTIEDEQVARAFKRIDDFMRTPHVVKLFYKLLQTAIDTDNESYLPVLLHLIHAVILEEQFKDGEDAGSLGAFVDIPIPNLLMTISESTSISKANARKADHILDLMVLRDASVIETLIDCFGEEHVAAYKKMKQECGGGFETKEELKKRLALERQAKIKRKFEKQQSKFAAKNRKMLDTTQHRDGDQNADVNMEDDATETSKNLKVCILCQTEQNRTEAFGFPCYVNKTSIFKQIGSKLVEVKLGFNDWSDQKLMDVDETSYGDAIREKIVDKLERRSALARHEGFERESTHSHHEADLDEYYDAYAVPEEGEEGEVYFDRDGPVDPVEVRFNEQMVGNHGNILSRNVGNIHNYIPSHQASRAQSEADEESDAESHNSDMSDAGDAVISSYAFGEDVVSDYVISSCNHGMHYKCFQEYVKKPASFKLGYQCPLCRSINNFFLPTLMSPADAKPLSFKTGAPEPEKYNQILEEFGQDNLLNAAGSFIDPEITSGFQNRTEEGVALAIELDKITKDNEVLQDVCNDGYKSSLSILLGNTIRMLEITSRFTTADENFTKMEVLSSQRDLLIALLQYRSIMPIALKCGFPETVFQRRSFYRAEVEDKYPVRYAYIKPFTEFIILYFQSNFSLATVAKAVAVKHFTIVIDSLLKRMYAQTDFDIVIAINGKERQSTAEDETLLKLKKFLNGEIRESKGFLRHIIGGLATYSSQNEDLEKNELLIGFYEAAVRLMLPFYRQLYFFMKVIDPSASIDGNKEESSPSGGAALFKSQMQKVAELAMIRSPSEYVNALLDEEDPLELNVFRNVLNSKIARFQDDGILMLDYPGIVKLRELPKSSSKFVEMRPKTDVDVHFQYAVCLLCGAHVQSKGQNNLTHYLIKHFRGVCKQDHKLLSIFLNPFNNTLNVILKIQAVGLESRAFEGRCFKYVLPSPYLDKHGESASGGLTYNFNGELNETRYNELNKLWLNQGIYAFLSRISADSTFTAADGFTTATFAPDEEEEMGFTEDPELDRFDPVVW